MSNPTKLLIGLIVVLVLGAGIALAQEEATEAINLDEDIQAQDLGISEPKVLPDSPFYFLKNWARGVQNVLTFNPIKKAELRLKIANEKLMEAKKIIQKTENVELIKKATENYQQETEKIKNQVEKIKEKAKENPEVEKFLDKFVDQQTLHQKLLQKLETQVPARAFEKIQEAREAHLETFQGVMLKLEDRREKITEKLDRILEEQKGSQFKEFKNLEVLKNLEEKVVPEEAKEAIKQAEENAIIRLKSNLEEMSPEAQNKFKEYTEKISGEKEKHLEILENLKAKIKEVSPTPQTIRLKEKLEEGKTKIFKKIEKRLEKLNCPLWVTPVPGFCKEGRVVMGKDENGCPLPPKCVIPGEESTVPKRPIEKIACITLWNPVCGKDGKTYSNECFAKATGVEIDYEGVCREKEVSTPLKFQPPELIPIQKELLPKSE